MCPAGEARWGRFWAERRLRTRVEIRVITSGRQGARSARREERAYREYVSNEQRSEAGCLGGRYVAVIVKRST